MRTRFTTLGLAALIGLFVLFGFSARTDADEMDGVVESELGLRPIRLFAQYTDEDGRDEIRARFERVHDCVRYEKRLTGRAWRNND